MSAAAAGGADDAIPFQEEHGIPFYVADGSGQKVRIATIGLQVLAKVEGYPTLSPEALERVRLFLAQRGHVDWQAHSYEEESLRVGERVNVVGVSHRNPIAPASSRYHDGLSTDLVVESASDHALIVAIPEVVERARGGAYLVGRAAIAFGLASFLTGLIARCWHR
jgi:hypothetical protein